MRALALLLLLSMLVFLAARDDKKKQNDWSDRNRRQDLPDPWEVQRQLPGWSGPPRSGQQPNGQTDQVRKGPGHGTLPNRSQQHHESPNGSNKEEDDQVGPGPVMQGGQRGQEQNRGRVVQSGSQSKEKSNVTMSTSDLTTTTIKETGMASNATVLPTEKTSTLKPSSSPLPKIPTSSPTTSATTTPTTTTTTPTTTEQTTTVISTIPLTITTVTIEATTEAPTTLPPKTTKPSSTVGPTTVPPPFVLSTVLTVLSTTDKPTVRSTTEKPPKSDVSEKTTRVATTETTIGSGNGNQSGTIIGHEKSVKKSVHGAVIDIPALVLLVLIVVTVTIIVVIRHKSAKKQKSKEKTSRRNSLEKRKPKSDVKAGSKTGEATKESKMQMSPPMIKEKRPPQPKPVQAGKLDQEHHKFVGPLRMDAQLKGPVRHGTEQAPRSGSLEDVVFDEKDNKVYEIGSDIEVMSKQVSRSVVVDDTDNTLIAGTVNQKTLN